MRRMPRAVSAGATAPSTRRRLAVAAGTLVFAAASMLTGCASGGGTAGSSSTTVAPDATPTTITVFAAASLTEAFDTLAAEFEAEHPNVDVVLSYGGSAALAQQIVEGAVAPADTARGIRLMNRFPWAARS